MRTVKKTKAKTCHWMNVPGGRSTCGKTSREALECERHRIHLEVRRIYLGGLGPDVLLDALSSAVKRVRSRKGRKGIPHRRNHPFQASPVRCSQRKSARTRYRPRGQTKPETLSGAQRFECFCSKVLHYLEANRVRSWAALEILLADAITEVGNLVREGP